MIAGLIIGLFIGGFVGVSVMCFYITQETDKRKACSLIQTARLLHILLYFDYDLRFLVPRKRTASIPEPT